MPTLRPLSEIKSIIAVMNPVSRKACEDFCCRLFLAPEEDPQRLLFLSWSIALREHGLSPEDEGLAENFAANAVAIMKIGQDIYQHAFQRASAGQKVELSSLLREVF
ncbi:MAG: hypothetical protein L6Q92_07625 [Phycisphaerae bacterium]|nr:hypothetical protein [Phycisphaerae bacterium]